MIKLTDTIEVSVAEFEEMHREVNENFEAATATTVDRVIIELLHEKREAYYAAREAA